MGPSFWKLPIWGFCMGHMGTTLALYRADGFTGWLKAADVRP